MEPTSQAYAKKRDREDPIKEFREEFHLPKDDDGNRFAYFCGHSLGAQPADAKEDVEREMERWARLGVEGHFKGDRPWYTFQDDLLEPTANLLGAKPEEVVYMNTLTTNLHLLFVTFYQPSDERHQILLEAGAFPSDQQVAISQARSNGFVPSESVVEVRPKPGHLSPTTSQIVDKIEEEGCRTRLVFLSPVDYRTGRVLNIPAIAEKAHSEGCLIGLDLAHAAGNIELSLHDWEIDFAAWCSYKYLNGGPGAIAGAFVHSKYAELEDEPRFEGWWGDNPESRFDGDVPFEPQYGAKAWQLSNPPILSMSPLKSSLELFEEAGPQNVRDKSVELTEYLFELLEKLETDQFSILTPRAAQQRGGQVSLKIYKDPEGLHGYLTENSVLCDLRQPNILRIAVAPLYNNFSDIWKFWNQFSTFFGE